MKKETIEKAKELYNKGRTKSDVMRMIKEEENVKERRAYVLAGEIFRAGNYSPVPSSKPFVSEVVVKCDLDKQTAVASYSGARITSLEDLLTQSNVDNKIWGVKNYSINTRESASKDENGAPVIVPFFQIRVSLEKKKGISDIKELAEEFNKLIRVPVKRFIAPPKNKKRDQLLILAEAQDCHCGRLVWGEETGGDNYDSNIAEDLFYKATNDLLSKVDLNRVEKIIFPLIGDFFNSDGGKNATTAGTPMTQDSRWQKIFVKGCEMICNVVDQISQIAPVEIVVVLGNHDEELIQHLGYYLNAWYRNNENVSIDCRPLARKYKTFGKNLLGFVHGDGGKITELGNTMSFECPKEWGESKYRLFLAGHLHQQIVHELKSVVVKVLPSLVATDPWHFHKNFVGCYRAAEAIVLDKEGGLSENYFYYV